MITAPICEFVRRYRYSGALRMHMPGHKGTALLGPEPLDLTEIEGADVLYHAEGIIRESEANAAALFGTKKTVYSAEGSSLCIRAMLYLALLHARANHKKPVIAAGRNAHKVFMTAAALLDLDIRWIYGTESVISCAITPAQLEDVIVSENTAAVSPRTTETATSSSATSTSTTRAATSRTSSPCPPSAKNTAYYCSSITPTAHTCVFCPSPCTPCSSAQTSAVIPHTKHCRS